MPFAVISEQPASERYFRFFMLQIVCMPMSCSCGHHRNDSVSRLVMDAM